MHYKQLSKYTISVANLIIIMVSNTRDAVIYSVFKPHLIVVNKANQVPKPNMWNVLGNYNSAALVMIKDEKQLPLLMISKPENNGFVNLLHLLLFSWLIVLSHICVWFNVQQQMVETIGGIAPHLFYKNMIQNSPDTLVDHCACSVDVKRYFCKAYNMNSPLL